MRIENLIFSLVGIHRQESKDGVFSDMILDITKLFNRATSSIQIVSGGFSHKVYCNEGVMNALDQALKKRCTVEVTVGPDADEECLKNWSTLGIPIYMLDTRPKRHFAIVDGKHVRVEDPHKPGHEKKVQYVIYNFKDARKLDYIFEELKERAKLLEN